MPLYRKPATAADLALKAPTANPTFTGTVGIPDGALAIADTSGLQTALDAKAPTANPTFTGTVTIPDGALAIADTSGLQTALDTKIASTDINEIVVMTQAAYTALGVKDSATLYYIVG